MSRTGTKLGTRKGLAAVVVGLLVLGIMGSAAATGGLRKTTVKTLKRQLTSIAKRVAALEAGTTGGPSPTGAAGGDLTGQYPNPTIAANAVGSAEITDGSIAGADIGTNAVGSAQVADGSLGAADLGTDSVASAEVAADAVGASELKTVTAVVSAGTAVNNSFGDATATCPAGTFVLGGGFAWQTLTDTGTSIIHSTPDPVGANPTSWVVRGRSANANNLFAWATCLAA